jgi:hypothetical protein
MAKKIMMRKRSPESFNTNGSIMKVLLFKSRVLRLEYSVCENYVSCSVKMFPLFRTKIVK